MKIYTKNQSSSLCNHDVKWYLFDEQLWLTKHNEYADIEKSIATSVGSFNWLYEVNDTVLFSKEDRRFETAVIHLSRKINIGNEDNLLALIKRKEKGELFLAEKRNCDFEFPSRINYAEDSDCLISSPSDIAVQDLSILFIVDDFGFIVMNDQLQGWILLNASKHICATRICEEESNNDRELLVMYLRAMNLWEADEEDTEGLKILLESIKEKMDPFSLAIKDSIKNIL